MSDAWESPVSGWPVGAWAMAGMLPIVGGIGVSANVLSPGLALDMISLWAGLLPVVVALVLVAIKRAWRRRMGALPPLLIITWIALVVAAHLAALEQSRVCEWPNASRVLVWLVAVWDGGRTNGRYGTAHRPIHNVWSDMYC